MIGMIGFAGLIFIIASILIIKIDFEEGAFRRSLNHYKYIPSEEVKYKDKKIRHSLIDKANISHIKEDDESGFSIITKEDEDSFDSMLKEEEAARQYYEEDVVRMLQDDQEDKERLISMRMEEEAARQYYEEDVIRMLQDDQEEDKERFISIRKEEETVRQYYEDDLIRILQDEQEDKERFISMRKEEEAVRQYYEDDLIRILQDEQEDKERFISIIEDNEATYCLFGLRDVVSKCGNEKGILYTNPEPQIRPKDSTVKTYSKETKNNTLSTHISKKNKLLFFDTETTGLPKNYNAPISDTSNWPRLVQLSWIMADEDANILSKKDFIIKPNGFVIPKESSEIHGITTDKAEREGFDLSYVLDIFDKGLIQADILVGHNIDFDINVLRSELYRLKRNDYICQKERLCTMKATVDYCKIISRNGYKYPKLQELYRKVFSRDFEDAHNSAADIQATLECYFELKKRNII